MNNLKRIMIFSLILFVSLTAVSAADLIDDDSNTVAVETQQVDQTNTETTAPSVQEENNEEEEETTSNDVVISQDVTITSTNVGDYTNKNWTVNQGVTVTGTTGVALTNVAIEINGNSVTLDNLEITNAAGVSNYIINATEKTDLTVKNSQLTITNTGAYDNTFGIYLKDVDGASIENNEITVNAPSRGMNWGNYTVGEGDDAYTVWYSIPSVASILVDSSKNIAINENTIAISKSGAYNGGSTMPAIVFRNQTNSSSITKNVITSSGAQYVYGIMVTDGADELLIKNNTVTSTGEYNVVGIDASTSTNSKVCKNIITATSHNTTVISNGSESLAYGILSDTYSTGNQNNIICNNSIEVNGNVIYGIEVYLGNTITVCTNIIRGTGNRAMGVAFAHTTGSKIINNDIQITGNTLDINYFYEEITPENTGILLTNQSNNNTIKGNYILVTAYGDEAALAINLTNDTDNNVSGNYAKVIKYTDEEIENEHPNNPEGNDVINDPEENDYVNNNIGVVLEQCDCDCDCGTTTEETGNEIEGYEFFATTIKSIKKDEKSNILYIDDNNYLEYAGSVDIGSTGGLIATINFLNLDNYSNLDVIVNFTQPIESLNFNGKVKSMIIDVTCSNTSDTFLLTRAHTNVYAPKGILKVSNINVTNCTLAGIQIQSREVKIENCTVINLNAPNSVYGRFSAVTTRGSINNTYVFYYFPQNGTALIGIDGIFKNNKTTAVIENITPSNENCYVLTNNNYTEFFDENNIIKEEYADSTIYAVENITSPVIVDKKVTLSAVRGHTGYDNVKFIEGSDESTIEDSLINNIEINNAILINIHNNKLIGENAQINLVEASNCIIEDNVITTGKEYTITLDENSMDNTIKNNQLTALKYTGDKSVKYTGENTIEENTPEYIATPELKVDTTEFTIGETTQIKASIYLGDEVATDLSRGKVVFKVNGVTLKDSNGKVIYAKLTNGVASIDNYEIPKTWNKEGLTITAVYSGSKDCEALRSEATELTITPEQSNPTINTEQTPTTATIGQTIQLKAKITDGTKAITTGKVVFKVNGKTVKDANGKVIYANVDTNGEVTVNYTIPDTMKAKDYTITITFKSAKYETITTNTTLTITKA